MFQPRLNSIAATQFRVKFLEVDGSESSFLQALSGTVVTEGVSGPSVLIQLEKKLVRELQDGNTEKVFEQRELAFTHQVPANKVLLQQLFERLSDGLEVDVTVQLIGGAAQEIVLHELKFKQVTLRLAGELKLGAPNVNLLVHTAGVCMRPITNIVQRNGSYHYDYA